MSLEKRPNALEPFRVAFRGLIYTFRTQRHMRVHLYVVVTVTLLGMFLGLRLNQLMVLLFVISLVLVAEMFNSAIEATVDLVQPQYDPKAKFAKDIAAGAVLITTIIAIVIGALMLLEERRWERLKLNLMAAEGIGLAPAARWMLGMFLATLLVVIGKGLGKKGQVLKGGLVSGHAAWGFFTAITIIFMTDQALVAALVIFLALLIAQSRWEAKIHSVFEVSLGAAVGVILGLVFFGLAPK
jgi:diacylglycerol kinase (ATP)